jgi:hypothetical protein
MAGTLNWNIPGCQLEVEREEIFATKVDLAESQTEVRTDWQGATARYRWKFKIIGRTNVSGVNEVGVLRALYESNRGKWDSFSMTDPLDGANIANARFDSTLRMRRLLANSARGAWWELSFDVISLLNAT